MLLLSDESYTHAVQSLRACLARIDYPLIQFDRHRKYTGNRATREEAWHWLSVLTGTGGTNTDLLLDELRLDPDLLLRLIDDLPTE
jgi:hypothetical protein